MSTRTIALIVAAVSVAIAVVCLYFTHPHEDAYILFIYVKHFVAGHGIVYYEGGPRTEGATDFLWFLALSGLNRIGVDIAVAAALVNAIGAGVIAYVLVDQVRHWSRQGDVATRLLVIALAVAPLLTGGAIAGFKGFGSTFYIAAVLLLASRLLNPTRGNLIAVPILALIVALIRPDGVIIGAGYDLIGLVLAGRRGYVKPFLISFAAAFVGGLFYFWWRYHYFGLLLPLPLYVKSHGSGSGLLSLPGIGGHWLWIKNPGGPLPLLLAVAALTWIAQRAGPEQRQRARAALLLLLPAFLHLAILLLANQLQNVNYRFQAPDAMILLLCALAIAAAVPRPGLRATLIMLPLALPLAAGIRSLQRIFVGKEFLDTFSVRSANYLRKDDTLVLTEAGRLAYWTDARVIDAVGLNDRHCALQPVSVEYIRSTSPDVFFFSTGGAFNGDRLALPERPDVFQVDAGKLRTTVLPQFAALLEKHGSSLYQNFSSIQVAPATILQYLEESADTFDTYLVRYEMFGIRYNNCFAVRRDHPNRQELIAALRQSFDPTTFRSYAQLKHFPFTAAGTPEPRSAHARP